MQTSKSTIAGIILTVLVVGAVLWGARGAARTNRSADTQSNTSAPGSLVTEEKEFDFGKVSMAAGRVSHPFTVRNTGVEPLTIQKLYTSCMCTEASLETKSGMKGPFGMPGHGAIPKIDETLAPGEEGTVTVTFDPAAHGPSGVGRIERIVYLEQNSGTPLEIRIRAMVTP
ncbi:MAG: DUF1573 domain-containing protein [Parcubacteria group bacterium]|nr:DUF1573 domain-containing protein [Parcubacteria group bacterium]